MTKKKSATRVADIDDMKTAAGIVSDILVRLSEMVEPGVSLLDLDKRAGELMGRFRVKSYDKGYHPEWAKTPFPGNICTSVNNCIGHGIPTPYKLKEGDIVNIDVGIKLSDTFHGACGDSAITVPVGKISNEDELLLKFAKRACYEGISRIKDGVAVADIGKAIMLYAREMGYSTNWAFAGHAIGQEMHQSPAIPSFFDKKNKKRFLQHYPHRLKAGQVVCIEPMLTYGKDLIGELHADGWSRLTRDGKNSAMFEHMVLVVDDGYEVLTNHFEEI